MKKIILFFVILIYIIFISNMVFAYEAKDKYFIDPYTIEDYNELANLYDELIDVYEEACQDASSYETEIKDKNIEIEDLKGKIKSKDETINNNGSSMVLMVIGGIAIMIAIIYFSNK